MSDYYARKREWQRALVRSIHGADEPELTSGQPDFDAGVRTDYMPHPEPRPQPPPVEPRELGWGDSIEVEDGAELFFPWLAREDDR